MLPKIAVILRCYFPGMDVLNSAIESIYKRVPPEKWEFVSVAVAPSTITITEHGVSLVRVSFIYLFFYYT